MIMPKRSSNYDHRKFSVDANLAIARKDKNQEKNSLHERHSDVVASAPSAVALLPDLSAINDLLNQQIAINSNRSADAPLVLSEMDCFFQILVERLDEVLVAWSIFQHASSTEVPNTTDHPKAIMEAELKMKSTMYTVEQALTVLTQWWCELCYLLQSTSELIYSALEQITRKVLSTAVYESGNGILEASVASELCNYDYKRNKVPIPVCVQHAFILRQPFDEKGRQHQGCFLPDIGSAGQPEVGSMSPMVALRKVCHLLCRIVEDVLQRDAHVQGIQDRFCSSAVVHKMLRQDAFHVFRTYKGVLVGNSNLSLGAYTSPIESPFTVVIKAHERIELNIGNALMQILQKQPQCLDDHAFLSTLLSPWYQLWRLSCAQGLRRVMGARVAVSKAVSSTTSTALASVAAKAGLASGRSSANTSLHGPPGQQPTSKRSNTSGGLYQRASLTMSAADANSFYENEGPENQKMMTQLLEIIAGDVNCIRALQLGAGITEHNLQNAIPVDDSSEDEAQKNRPPAMRRRSTQQGIYGQPHVSEEISSSDDEIDHKKRRRNKKDKTQKYKKKSTQISTLVISELQQGKCVSSTVTRLLVETQILLDLILHCLIIEISSSSNLQGSSSLENNILDRNQHSRVPAILTTLLSPLLRQGAALNIFNAERLKTPLLSPIEINGVDVIFYTLESFSYFDTVNSKTDMTSNDSHDQQTPNDFQQLQHRSITIATEIIWHILTILSSPALQKTFEAPEVIGFRARFNLNVILYRVLTSCVLPFSFKQEIRELRNDIIVILSLMANHRLHSKTISSASDRAIVFEYPLIHLLLQISSQLEINCIRILPHAPEEKVVDPRHHNNHKNLEDFSLKVITWDLLATLCRADDADDNESRSWVAEWVPSLLLYLDINCTFECVTAWSTPLLLELQQYVLVILRYIVPLQRHHLKYPVFLRETTADDQVKKDDRNLNSALQVLLRYVHHCPSARLRNLSISFLATCAMCMKSDGREGQISDRDELHKVGTIPLALLLLNISVVVLRERNVGLSFSHSRGEQPVTDKSTFSSASDNESFLTSIATSLYDDTVPTRVVIGDTESGSQLIFHWQDSSDEDILALMIDCLQLLSDLTYQQPHRQIEFSQGPGNSNRQHINGVELLFPVLQEAVGGIRSPVSAQLKASVAFGVVDLIYSAVVGCPENSAEFIRVGGIGLILSLLQRRQATSSTSFVEQKQSGHDENMLPDWMLPLPLSCLADLLTPSDTDTNSCQIQEKAGRQLIEWQGTRRSRKMQQIPDSQTGLQVLLSLWSSSPPSEVLPVDVDDRWPLSLWDQVGLAALGPPWHREVLTLPIVSSVASRLMPSSDKNMKCMVQQNECTSIEQQSAYKEVTLMLNETGRRNRCMLSPNGDEQDEKHIVMNCDIAHWVLPNTAQKNDYIDYALNFKIYAVLSRLGFLAAPPADNHDIDIVVPKPHSSGIEPIAAALADLRLSVSSNLSAQEKTSLTQCENFYLLCQDEVWRAVAASLVAHGIRVDFAGEVADRNRSHDSYQVCCNDGKILQKCHLQAVIRAKKLGAARICAQTIDKEQEKRSELHFYKSLIKSASSSPGF